MKITREYLRRVIKEEIQKTFNEEETEEPAKGDIELGRRLNALLDSLATGISMNVFAYQFIPDILQGGTPTADKNVIQGVKNLAGQYSVLKTPRGAEYAAHSMQMSQERDNKNLPVGAAARVRENRKRNN